MRGALISQSANLAPAHGVGLAGKRERPHARPADASGGEVAIDDGVDLVSALRRLVDALRITGDDAGAGVEQIEEVADVLLAQAGCACGCSDVRRNLPGAHERRVE